MKNKKLSEFLNHNLPHIPQRTINFQPNIKLRRIKESNEKLLQSIRKKSHRKPVQSHSVLVTSRQELDLMRFIDSSNLPKLTPIIKRKKSSLDRILSKKNKFKKKYFGELHNYQKHGEKEQISYQFQKVKVGEWTVSGFILGDYILLKGVTKKKQQYKKFKYAEVYKEIRQDYQSWVEQQFLNQL